MKLFIAGATGVLGRRVVARCVAAGHTVVGLSRSAANTDWLARHGAEARPGDLFNAAQMAELAAGCEGILHLATAIPRKTRTRRADWALNDRIRTEGTRALVAAAVKNHCQVYVQQSVTFVYGDHGDDWIDEATPVNTQPGGILQSALEMEQIVAAAVLAQGLPAVVLRLGAFYCFDSVQTRALLDSARRGQLPIIGSGQPFWSQIQVDEAASAVLAALSHSAAASGHTYNVVDDAPARYGEIVRFINQALGTRAPMNLPPAVARLFVGAETVRALTTSQRVRNQRIKAELGWQPGYPTFREGYMAEIKKLEVEWKQ
jgi:nucleoside-diphosphate-sugar epimerase